MSAAATPEEKKEATPSASAPASGGNKLALILTLVNTLATIGMIAILFISFNRDKKKPAVEDIAAHGLASEGEAKKGEEKGGEGHGGEGEKAKEPAKKKTVDFGKMVTLDQFTVNLSTPGSVNPKFVRVNVSIEVPNDDTENEVNSKMPQVRNTIIDLFNSKRPADLATSEGRDYLKDEIRNALNAFMVSGKVRGVFFTNFAVSS